MDESVKSSGYVFVNEDGKIQLLPERKASIFSVDGSSVRVKEGVFTVEPEIINPLRATVTNITDREIAPSAISLATSVTLEKPLTSTLLTEKDKGAPSVHINFEPEKKRKV